MKKFNLLYLLLLLFPFLAIGQKASISGKIMAKGEALSFTAIQLSGENYSQGEVSDEQGNFRFDQLQAGTYTLQLSSLGYQSYNETIELQAGQQLEQQIALQEDWLELEQVVVTGTRNQVALYDSPVIVNKISNRTFETTQALSLSEGLNFSPGLRVETNCQNCGFTQLRMNGLEGAYSQILINSRPIFSALAGVYGLEMIPANMVDRIEVVKGGGSVAYGGNAIAGTVNIITKDPINNSFEVGLNQAFVNAETSDRTLSLNGTLVSDDLSKGMSFYAFNRQRAPWDANDDGFSEITKINNTTFGFNAFWNISERSKLKLNGYNITEFRRGGNRFDLEPHQTDITEQLQHNILGGDISYELYSRDFRHKIAVYASAQHTERDSYYGGGGRVLQPGDSLTEDDLLALNAYGESEDIAIATGLQYNFELNKEILLTLGSELQYNKVTDRMPGYERLIDQRVRTIGSYAQLEWEPTDKLSILAGGRLDLVDIEGEYLFATDELPVDNELAVLVPRLSVLYDFTSNLKGRASFAQGYRAPQAFDEDLHIETVGGAARFIQLDPDLATERSNNFTASLNYSLARNGIQSNFVLEGFYTQLTNPFLLSDPVEQPNGIAIITKRNGSGASVQGINLEANVAFGSKWLLQSSATIQSATYEEAETLWSPAEDDPRDPTTTTRLLRTPDVYGFLTAVYTPIRPLQLSVSGVFTGPMDVPRVVDVDTEYTIIERSPSFMEVNLKAAYTFEFGEQYDLELFGGVQNLFNSFQDDFDRGADRDSNYVYGPNRPLTIFTGIKFGLN